MEQLFQAVSLHPLAFLIYFHRRCHESKNTHLPCQPRTQRRSTTGNLPGSAAASKACPDGIDRRDQDGSRDDPRTGRHAQPPPNLGHKLGPNQAGAVGRPKQCDGIHLASGAHCKQPPSQQNQRLAYQVLDQKGGGEGRVIAGSAEQSVHVV